MTRYIGAEATLGRQVAGGTKMLQKAAIISVFIFTHTFVQLFKYGSLR